MDILKDKQYKSYDKLSRYSPFPVYYNELDNKYMYGTTNHLNDTTKYGLYQVQTNDTYDLIALKFYNNPTYYWIICDFNRINDPFKTPIPGVYIKIPAISTLEFLD